MNRTFIFAIIVQALLSAGSAYGQPSTAADGEWKLVWSDEFEGDGPVGDGYPFKKQPLFITRRDCT